jgi:hypothetical protein
MTTSATAKAEAKAATTKSVVVNKYTGAAAKLPDEYFLGQVVSFTITEADVNLDELREQVIALGLKDDTLKKRLRPIDAFKKACNDVAVKFTKTVDAQHGFMIRPVGQDAQESHRHIVFERAIFKTGQKRRIEYDTVMKLIYNRGYRDGNTGQVVEDSVYVERVPTPGLILSDEEEKWLLKTVGTEENEGANLKKRYKHYSTHLDSHGVRTFVREYLYSLGAINVKGAGGGLYFIQQKHAAELRDLASLITGIGSSMHLIPLLDIVEQRDMLAEAFISDTMEEVRQVSVEMSKILKDKDRTITEATFDSYAAKAAGLIEKAREYQGLLDRNLDTASFELDIFQKQTLKLINRIRRPKSLGSGGN